MQIRFNIFHFFSFLLIIKSFVFVYFYLILNSMLLIFFWFIHFLVKTGNFLKQLINILIEQTNLVAYLLLHLVIWNIVLINIILTSLKKFFNFIFNVALNFSRPKYWIGLGNFVYIQLVDQSLIVFKIFRAKWERWDARHEKGVFVSLNCFLRNTYQKLCKMIFEEVAHFSFNFIY